MTKKSKNMNLITKQKTLTMKTLRHVMLLLLCCGLFSTVSAQLVCGVNASYTVSTNPNGAHVFVDGSTIQGGWTVTNYYWDFGDGSTSNLQNPTHYFSLPGTYNVCHYVIAIQSSTNTTCIDTACTTITTCNTLVGGFSFTNTNPPVVNFNSFMSSNYLPITYSWDFGDGSTSSSGPTEIHTYAWPGTYTVCLTATDANGCTQVYCQPVNVNPAGCGNVNASFNGTVNGTTLTLTSTSTGAGSNTNYQWYIDGNPTAPSAGLSTYTVGNLSVGTHQVCLYLWNGSTWCDSTCNTYTVAGASGCGNIQANFSANVNPNGVGVLQSTSSGTTPNNSYQWLINGQFIGSPSPNNNIYTYQFTPGVIYNVCLYVYSGNNFCDSICQTITVPGSGCNTDATFTASNNGNGTVTLLGVNSNADNHAWYVSGATSNTWIAVNMTSQNYVWAISPGVYTVCHIASIGTQGSCADTFCTQVLVSQAGCNVSAVWTPTSNGGNTYTFIGNGNSGNVLHSWNFGDGTVTNVAQPTHTFQQPGTYNVCHICSIPGTLCADTFCNTITVTAQANCYAAFQYTLSQQGVLYTANFTNYSSAAANDSIVGTLWTVSNGTTSTDWEPTFTFTAPGTYQVCLICTTAANCYSTFCDTIVIQQGSGCNAQFTASSNGCSSFIFDPSFTAASSYLWNFGDNTTSTSVVPTHTYTTPGVYTVMLTITTANGCTNSYTQVVTVTTCNTICGIIFYDTNGNGVQDAGEQGVPNAYVYVNNTSTYTAANGQYTISVAAGTYNIYYCAPQNYSFTLPINPNASALQTCATYNVTVSGSNTTNCGFNFGIQNNSVSICGLVYFDANNNGTQDVGETGLSNVQVRIASGGTVYTTYTSLNGSYCRIVPPGSYTVTVNPASYQGGSVSPLSYSITATAGQSFPNKNFGIYFQPGSGNLSINITPHTTVTAGFPAWYDIQVTNIGASPMDAVVNMFYDPTLVFDYASPVQASHNASTRTLSWNITNILPGQHRYYWVNFDAIAPLTLGQFVFTLANVIPNAGFTDVNMANNVDTVHQAVTGSWDPNNKLVEPIGVGEQGLISPTTEKLQYTINFQNTGTAPAVNVVLHDEFETDLDLESFQMIGASHDYHVHFEGRKAVWVFSGIMLPDSTNDEPNSHGFVKFAISPNAGLAQGTQLTNTADIYFDYNEAVVTNTALNTIDYTLSIGETPASNVSITLQPNPFNQYTNIRIEGAGNDAVELNVYDLIGNVVKSEISNNSNVIRINRDNMATGMYLYEIRQNGKLLGQGKMIAE
jgi:PKD repeat protein